MSNIFPPISLLSYTLPAEIVTEIFSYIPSPLAGYSTVSREFQLMIESATFRQIRFQIHPEGLPHRFRDLFRLPHRRQALKRLTFELVDVQGKKCTRKPYWGDAIILLLYELSSWEKGIYGWNGAIPNNLKLRFEHSFNPSIRLPKSVLGRDIKRCIPVLIGSYLDSLPSVSFVQSLAYVTCHADFHCLDPAQFVKLSTKFPILTDFALRGEELQQYSTMFARNVAQCQVRRIELSKSLLEIPLLNTRLKSLKLTLPTRNIQNYKLVPPSLVPPNTPGGLDPFSVALHTISIKCVGLEYLHIYGTVVVGPEIFWPEKAPQNEEPRWPNLRQYYLCIDPIAPDGQWYFIPPPKESLEEDEQDEQDEDNGYDEYDSESNRPNPVKPFRENHEKGFRTRFNVEKFASLMKAMTMAVTNMPNIQRFEMEMKSESIDTIAIINAFDIGQSTGVGGRIYFKHPPKDELDRRRWYTYLGWEAANAWNIPEEIHKGWKEWVGEDGLVAVALAGGPTNEHQWDE